MLSIIGLVLALAILVIIGLALTRPATFSLQRDILINAPREKIFPMVNDFHNWASWSPWEKIDPAMQRTYSGAGSGVGAMYAWSGNRKAGAGHMEIINSTVPSNVGIKLDFIKPFEAHNITDFKFDSTAAGTHVTWSMRGDNNFISKVMTVFISMEKLVAPDFERGLANMKTQAELRS